MSLPKLPQVVLSVQPSLPHLPSNLHLSLSAIQSSKQTTFFKYGFILYISFSKQHFPQHCHGPFSICYNPHCDQYCHISCHFVSHFRTYHHWKMFISVISVTWAMQQIQKTLLPPGQFCHSDTCSHFARYSFKVSQDLPNESCFMYVVTILVIDSTTVIPQCNFLEEDLNAMLNSLLNLHFHFVPFLANIMKFYTWTNKAISNCLDLKCIMDY